MISSGNDEYVGNLIAEAIEKIGPDGVISIESSKSSETSVIIEEGMKVNDLSAKRRSFLTSSEDSIILI